MNPRSDCSPLALLLLGGCTCPLMGMLPLPSSLSSAIPPPNRIVAHAPLLHTPPQFELHSYGMWSTLRSPDILFHAYLAARGVQRSIHCSRGVFFLFFFSFILLGFFLVGRFVGGFLWGFLVFCAGGFGACFLVGFVCRGCFGCCGLGSFLPLVGFFVGVSWSWGAFVFEVGGGPLGGFVFGGWFFFFFFFCFGGLGWGGGWVFCFFFFFFGFFLGFLPVLLSWFSFLFFFFFFFFLFFSPLFCFPPVFVWVCLFVRFPVVVGGVAWFGFCGTSKTVSQLTSPPAV